MILMNKYLFSLISSVFKYTNHNVSLYMDLYLLGKGLIRDKDPDPVGSVDFWPAGSGFYL